MSSRFKIAFVILVIAEVILLSLFLLDGANFDLLNPKGLIAQEQKDLMFFFVGVMLMLAIPLLTVFYWFSHKYKESKKLKNQKPLKIGSGIQIIWWIVPSLFILFMSIISWDKTHALDPYKPLESATQPVTIQVVALDWKWLFLYPEFGIATVNFLQFPEDTPINFELTADAPMNSFWIPSLSGQIYAMTGMSTKLHILANETGAYRGQAAEINGKGFSGMKFTTRVTSNKDFDDWVDDVKASDKFLDRKTYEILALPSEKNETIFYSSYEANLYQDIILKYMPVMDSHQHN